MNVVSGFLAFVGVLVGLRFWSVLLQIVLSLSRLADPKPGADPLSDENMGKVRLVVWITASVWLCLFGGIALWVGSVSANPKPWVAVFLGIALGSVVGTALYFLALRRIRARRSGAPLAKEVEPTKARTFLKWLTRSLPGNLVFCQILYALPMFILFVYLNYSEGSLTVSWGVWIAFVAACSGIFMGLFLWFFVARPLSYDREAMRAFLAKRRSNNRWRGP